MDNTKELAKYTAENGSNIVLTPRNIREIISTDPSVTDKEVMLFAAMCKAHALDPFNKEAYLIKYGKNPATMVVSKDVFLKRAAHHPKFRGYSAGLTLKLPDGGRCRREGSLSELGETIMGAWCKVYLDGYEVPMYDEVSFDEYAGRRKDGSLNSQWASKPGTMIRKVAIVHALREAFPDEFGGLYESTEMNVEEPSAIEEVVEQPIEDPEIETTYIPVYEIEEMEAF